MGVFCKLLPWMGLRMERTTAATRTTVQQGGAEGGLAKCVENHRANTIGIHRFASIRRSYSQLLDVSNLANTSHAKSSTHKWLHSE